MGFLRNAWYAAAWADEIAAGSPVARTIIGDPVVMWRDEAGRPVALADICPHRLAPLSKGLQQGNTLRCNYHGLRFNTLGECVENPHGPLLKSLCVRSYPLVEHQGMLWIWMGQPAAADPVHIPDVLGFTVDAPVHSWVKGATHVAANHKLFEDNILDPGHADYLHPLLGGGGMSRSKRTVEARGNQLYLHMWIDAWASPPIMAPEFADPAAPTDQWIEVWWHPCGAMLLRGGATPAGRPESEGIDTWTAHIYTPETQGKTHYFYASGRNYKVDDAGYNAGMAIGLKMAFEQEDLPMIEAQQQRIGNRDLMEAGPQLFAMDSASIRARRMYDRLLAAEQAQASREAA